MFSGAKSAIVSCPWCEFVAALGEGVSSSNRPPDRRFMPYRRMRVLIQPYFDERVFDLLAKELPTWPGRMGQFLLIALCCQIVARRAKEFVKCQHGSKKVFNRISS